MNIKLIAKVFAIVVLLLIISIVVIIVYITNPEPILCIDTYVKATQKPKTTQLIPRVIYQTHETNCLSQSDVETTNKLIAMNPTYSYKFFTAEDRIAFLKANFDERVLKAYNKIIPGAFKADLFRYCLMYIYGGVYIDMQTETIKPLDKLINRNDTFLIPFEDHDFNDNGDIGYSNAFIASIPKHPILKQVINKCVENIERNYLGEDYDRINSLYITGPLMLGKIFPTKYKTPFVHKHKTKLGYIYKNDELVMIKHYSTFRNFDLFYKIAFIDATGIFPSLDKYKTHYAINWHYANKYNRPDYIYNI